MGQLVEMEARAARIGHQRWRGGLLAGLILVGITLRLLLMDLGLVLYTMDSADYLVAAYQIVSALDFMGAGLYDWRMPGYPLFLALLHLVSNDLGVIMWAQSAIGIGAVLVGGWIGWQGRSWLANAALIAYLAFCPVLLLFERFIMSETLFVFSLLLFTVTVLHAYDRGASNRTGFILGLLLALNALIRVNSLFFTLPLAVALLWAVRHSGPPKRFVLTSLTFAVIASTLLGAWVWRNYSLTGVAALSLNVERNRLIYLKMHDLLDPALPSIEAIDAPVVDSFGVDPYAVIGALRAFRPVQAEQRSRQIVQEAIAHNPSGYRKEIVLSGLRFSGVPLRGVINERAAVQGWFALLEQGQSFEPLRVSLEGYSWRIAEPHYPPTFWGLWWWRLGEAYLLIVRPLLLGGALVSWLFGLRWASRGSLTTGHFGIVTLGFAYLCTVAAHAIFLADYDRFYIPFDWVYVAIITFALTEWRVRTMNRAPLCLRSTSSA